MGSKEFPNLSYARFSPLTQTREHCLAGQACKTFLSSHERKFKILFGFSFNGTWIPDSNRYWDPRSLSRIPDSKAQNSGLQKKRLQATSKLFPIPESGFTYMGQFSSFCVLGVNKEDNSTPGGGGGGVLGLIFAGYVPLASQSPYPIIGYSVANYGPFFRLNEEHITFISSTNWYVC